MFPWDPLEQAGILSFIDGLVKVFVSADSLSKRAYRCAKNTADFLQKSVNYLRDAFGVSIHGGTMPDPDTYMGPGSHKPSSEESVGGPQPVSKRSSKPPMFEESETQQVKDEYLQCVEQKSVPVYKNMGTETAQAIAKNQSAVVTCKLNMLQTYSNLTNNRA